MKLIKMFSITIIVVLLNATFIFADSSTIRLGLESSAKNINTAQLANTSLSVGYSVNNIHTEGAVITSNQNFIVTMPYDYYVQLNTSFTSYDQAKNASTAFNNGTVGYLGDNNWCVVIKEATKESATNLSNSTTGSKVSELSGKKVVLSNGSTPIIVFLNDTLNPSFKGSNGQYATINNRQYRGYLEVYKTTPSLFSIVNVVNVEEYLYAVVPSEMPASWSIEALKAQAVAARTYAATTMTKHSADGYNLCDKEHCQMYIGVTNENANSTNAVVQTSGQKAYYNGSPIQTLFYSSSGGVTANSEDVWSTPFAYLKEKKDPYDREGLVWTRNITTADLTGMLTKAGQNIGTPTSIVIDEVSANGRVNKITIKGTTGSYSLAKESVRTFFSYGDKPSLQSRLFNVTGNQGSTGTSVGTNTINHDVYVTNGKTTEKINLASATVQSRDNKSVVNTTNIFIKGKDTISSFEGNPGVANNQETVSGTAFVISGKGYGHGVGLSQYGAKGMAEDGFKYVDILKYYYTGIDVY